MGAVLAALAGINVISGPGMMNYETTISLEKLLIDDEICGLALRLVKGIVQREDPIALHLFEDFDPATSFLTLAHTRKWYRQDHSTVKLADRDNYEAWLRGRQDDRRAGPRGGPQDPGQAGCPGGRAPARRAGAHHAGRRRPQRDRGLPAEARLKRRI